MLATGIPRSFARNWKLVNSLMSLVFPQRRECGANHHKQKFHATRGEALQRRATPMGNSGRRPRRTRRSKQELEEDSLAARHKGMAGIAIRGLTSTAVSWLRPWSTTAQGSLVADRMARVRKGTDQVLPLRSASHLHTATISTAREVSLEDRARLPATEGGTGIGSLRRAKLDRLAPPHDAGYVGSRISNSGSASQ